MEEFLSDFQRRRSKERCELRLVEAKPLGLGRVKLTTAPIAKERRSVECQQRVWELHLGLGARS